MTEPPAPAPVVAEPAHARDDTARVLGPSIEIRKQFARVLTFGRIERQAHAITFEVNQATAATEDFERGEGDRNAVTDN